MYFRLKHLDSDGNIIYDVILQTTEKNGDFKVIEIIKGSTTFTTRKGEIVRYESNFLPNYKYLSAKYEVIHYKSRDEFIEYLIWLNLTWFERKTMEIGKYYILENINGHKRAIKVIDEFTYEEDDEQSMTIIDFFDYHLNKKDMKHETDLLSIYIIIDEFENKDKYPEYFVWKLKLVISGLVVLAISIKL